DPQDIAFTNVEVTNINDAGAVGAIAAPNTAARATAFAGLSPQEHYVQTLYLDILGRPGSVTELDKFWVPLLSAPGGAQAVVTGMRRSLEGRDHLVQTWYMTYLGRHALGGEESGLVIALLKGASESTVLSGILGSAEFLAHAHQLVPSPSASPDVLYVEALYQ